MSEETLVIRMSSEDAKGGADFIDDGEEWTASDDGSYHDRFLPSSKEGA